MCKGRQLVEGTWNLRSSGGFISDWLCSVPRGNTPISGQSALGDLPKCNFHFNFIQKESNSCTRRWLCDGNRCTSRGINRVMASNACSSAKLKCDFPVPVRQDHAPVQRQHCHAGPGKAARMSAPLWTWNWSLYTSTWLSVTYPHTALMVKGLCAATSKLSQQWNFRRLQKDSDKRKSSS